VRALDSFKKLLSVTRESVGPKILGHGDLMRDAPLVRCLPFPRMGGTRNIGVSYISLKRETRP
jgi:hypothetical protein